MATALADAGPPPTPETGAAPDSITADNTRSMFEVVPDSDTVLAVLTTVDGKCRWSRFDPITRKKSDMVEFAHCPDEYSWSPDARLALGLVDRATDDGPEMPRLDFVQRSVLLTVGPATFSTHGIDAQGQAWALTFEAMQPTDGGFFVWEGQKIPASEAIDGLGGLAHSWRLDATGKWQHVEAKASFGEACDTPGEHVFSVESSFGPTMDPGIEDATEEIEEEEPILQKLEAATKGRNEYASGGIWRALRSVPGTYLRVQDEGGRISDPDLVAFRDADKVTLVQGESISVQGHYLLVGNDLYDAATRKPVFRSAPEWNGNLHFWPRPVTKTAQP